MRRIGIAVLGLGVIARICAQPVCSPVNFVSAPEVTLNDKSAATVAGLQKLADGTFTQHRFRRFAPYGKLDAAANFQQRFFNCTALGPRNIVPSTALPRFGANSLGITSREAIVADLTGDDSPFVLRIDSRAAPDQLIVGVPNPDVSLKQFVNYPVGSVPVTLLTADFNGDGKPDVAVVSQGSSNTAPGSVSILLGNGDGTLRPAVNYPVGLQPFFAAAQDFNGDGKIDLAVTNTFSNNVSILLGNGDGTFRAAVNYPAGQEPFGVAAVDLNGDGRIDLAVTNNLSHDLSILLGNGDGTFRVATNISLGGSPFFVAAGDFNKDQKTDLAVLDFGGSVVHILLGSGGGNLQRTVSYSVGFSPQYLFVTDFDSDGNPDVVIGTGDPNGITANPSSGTVTVLFGNGDGTFYGPPRYFNPGGSQQIAGADFNGDGKPDLVTANGGTGGLSVFLGNGNGTFQAPLNIAINGPSAIAAAPGDFNGDGKTDLAVLDASGQVLFEQGKGDGTFLAGGSFLAGTGPAAMVAADFNGDGKLDVAVAINESVAVLLGNGNGTFQTAVLYPAAAKPNALVTADLNGDGKPDLVVATRGTFNSTTDPGGVFILLNKGNGTFQAPANTPGGRNPQGIAVADINGDRKMDLLLATYSPDFSTSVAVLLGNGNGTFQAPVFLPTDTNPVSLAAADLNSDGKPDVVVSHCCGRLDLTYLLSNGDGTFQPEVHFGVFSPKALVVQDFNGDTKPDLAVLTSDGAFSVLLNVSQKAPPAGALTIASAASGQAVVAPDSIASAYGARLATGTALANAVPWPNSLGGTGISLVDAAGAQRSAPLYYASAGQVNFLVPAGVAPGTATFTITAGDGAVSTGTVQVAPVAPGLFVLNQAQLAAANVLRVTADGTQTVEPVEAPIDLGPDTDQVFLILYGTGLRNRSSLDAVSAVIGGQAAAVSYAGSAGDTPGLDQVNVLLPRTLEGSGEVVIQLTADGKAANPVHVTVQ